MKLPHSRTMLEIRRVNYMPYPGPDRLVQINATHALTGISFGVSYPDYLDYVKYNRSFEGMALFTNMRVDLTGAGEPERVRAIRASSSLFTVLGRAPLHGRVFMNDDDKPGANAVAIISYGLWQSKFSGDAGIFDPPRMNYKHPTQASAAQSGLKALSLECNRGLTSLAEGSCF